MRFTVLGTTLGSASLALQMAREAHAESQQQLVRSMRLLLIAEKDLAAAKESAAKIVAEESPEPFQKIGDRYISERDVKATIEAGVRAATEDLLAKLAALPPSAKGKK